MSALDEAQRLAMRGHSADAIARLEHAGYVVAIRDGVGEEPVVVVVRPPWTRRLLARERVAESKGAALGIVLAVALDGVRRGA